MTTIRMTQENLEKVLQASGVVWEGYLPYSEPSSFTISAAQSVAEPFLFATWEQFFAAQQTASAA